MPKCEQIAVPRQAGSRDPGSEQFAGPLAVLKTDAALGISVGSWISIWFCRSLLNRLLDALQVLGVLKTQ